MSKEILMVAEAVSAEKGVSEDIIFEAIELALATAAKKRYEEEADIEVVIDRVSGEYQTRRRWLVVPDTELALLGTQFTTEEAAEADANLQIGDVHEEIIENADFGRIAAQTAVCAAMRPKSAFSIISSCTSPICKFASASAASSVVNCVPSNANSVSGTTSQRLRVWYSPLTRSITTSISASSS